ncbi:MAG: CpsD/CapB family tyrosine-protein kinase [Clostridia bacterium]|nr:CpsD/CapB family tyrosine-protein kinase [Clostridia bacterium]
MKNEVVAHIDPKSPISEIFRTLRTNIQFINNDKKTKTLLVTSTFPGEGKSWITANLAVTFAQAGKKVVLIDADMRKGRQYAIFGAKPKPGLSNFLSQIGIKEEENISREIMNCMQKTEVKNLYIIPAGNIPPNPSELLVSSKMIKLLEKLESVCDLIIIDGTPCELVTDSLILSRMVDSTIIVTAHKVTKKDALARVVKNIQNVGGNITGVLINKMPVSTKRYEERYYYYGKDPSFFNDNIKQVKKVAPIEIQKPIVNTENQKTEDILKQMNDYLDKTKRRKDK